jgi:hypothetical protein
VPHCHGWLALDARGDWYMRDDATQRAGPFPRVKGSRIVHARLLEFIGRNYGCDTEGAWHFQNGPQRVYVQLEAAPWTWRVIWPMPVVAIVCFVPAGTRTGSGRVVLSTGFMAIIEGPAAQADSRATVPSRAKVWVMVLSGRRVCRGATVPRPPDTQPGRNWMQP